MGKGTSTAQANTQSAAAEPKASRPAQNPFPFAPVSLRQNSTPGASLQASAAGESSPAVGAQSGGQVAASISTTVFPAERRLMTRVFERWHSVILAACRMSSVPAVFLAALTANESSGYADARRFEPAVFAHLEAVARGERRAYGAITRVRLEQKLKACTGSKTADEVLHDLATSWGLTQIMGYHLAGRSEPVSELMNPEFHFHFALELLAGFAREFHLNPAKDFEEMFHCWNTGQPYGPPRGPATYDPHYVENGMRRMEIYSEIQNRR